MASRIEYMEAAMAKAEYEEIEDGRFFGTIPGFDGVWAVGQTRDRAAEELRDVLDGWLKVHNGNAKHDLPDVDVRKFRAKAREEWNREHATGKLSPEMIPALSGRPDEWSRSILERVAERPA